MADELAARSTLTVGDRSVEIFRLDALQQQWDVARLPYTLADPARERAPQRLARGRRGRRRLGRDRRAEPRDLVRARPRAAAGLHGRAGRRRPRRDAQRDGRFRRRPGADQPADPGRARDRPLRAGGRLRHRHGLRAQRRARVRAQPRALRLPALGPERLPRLQGRAAGNGDRAPGQPRVPRPRGRGARRRRLPRHARRHRLAHDDGERARRPRLGRRRNRGRGCDARRAALDARPEGRRLQADGQAPGGRDRDRSRPDRDGDPAPGRRRREVRRVLRARAGLAAPRRPRHDREHVARVRRHLRLLPRRRADARLPAADRPEPRADRARRGLLQGEHALARPERRADVLAGTRARPLDRRALARRPAAAAGPRPAHAREDVLPGCARDVRRRERTHERQPRQGRRRHLSGERPDDRAGPGRRRGARARRDTGRCRRPGPEARPRRRDRLRARARLGRDRGDHLLHEHVEPAGDGRRRPPGEEGGRARAHEQALGEDEPRPRVEGRDRVLRPRRPDAATWSSSASTPSATGARRASGTPARSPSRSRSPSRRATSSSAPSSPATATSRRASTRR